MKKFLCAIVLALFCWAACAQDVIVLRNADEIQSKVLLVGIGDITYKKWDNLEGPSYQIAKKDVLFIMYANGTKEVFNQVVPEQGAKSPTKRKVDVDSVRFNAYMDVGCIFTKGEAGPIMNVTLGFRLNDGIFIGVQSGIDALFDRQTIFDFKDGCNQPQVAQFVAKELVRKFGRKIGKVVFSCVPASSQERNEERNKAFSALVCQLSGAIDGFSHVKVSGERSAVHGTKMKKEVRAKRLEESNTIEVDASFFRNKIVCVWDDVVTTGTSFCAYAAQLERVGAHVTNGIFLGKTSYRYVPTY